METLISYFQTLSSITNVSDKITSLLIFIVVIHFVDQRLLLSDNYRKNEIYARLNTLYSLSGTTQNGKTEISNQIVKGVIINEIKLLNKDLEIRKIVSKPNSVDKLKQRESSWLDAVTASFWFGLYALGSIIYIVVDFVDKKGNSTGTDKAVNGWIYLSLILGILLILGSLGYVSYLICIMIPIIYNPVINYVLNIVICSYFLNAVSKVLASFFITNEISKESTDLTNPISPIRNLKLAWNGLVRHLQFQIS